MNAEDVDILVGFSQYKTIPDNLKARKLFDSTVSLYASPAYLEQYGYPKNAQDLLDHQYIAHTLREPLDEATLANGNILKFAKPAVVVNALEVLLELCLRGNGLAMIGNLIAKKYVENGSLVRVLPNLPYPTHEVNLYYRSHVHQQAKIRYFIDFLVKKIQFD